MLQNIILLLFVINLFAYTTVYSAEVSNLEVKKSGNRIEITYDLAGSNAEEDVKATLTYKGKIYPAKDLHLDGDVGKVGPGKGKRIYWNVLQDFKRGISGELLWEIISPDRYMARETNTSWGVQSSRDNVDVLTFKRGVQFNHKEHYSIINCRKCHENGPGKIENFGKDWGHKNCKGCHYDMKKGPTSCKACHK